MKKVDVIRMIASMPDETEVYFNNDGKEIAIDNAMYIKGRLVFGVAPTDKIKEGDTIKITGVKSVKDGEYKVKASK